MAKRRPSGGNDLTATFTDATQLEKIEETLDNVGFPIPIVSLLNKDGWTLERPEVLKLMEKAQGRNASVAEYVKGRFYRGILTGLNEASLSTTLHATA